MLHYVILSRKSKIFYRSASRSQHSSAQATRSECRAFTGGRMSTDAMSSLDCTGFRRVTASTTSVLMMLMHTSAAPRTCPHACTLVGQGPPSLSALKLSRGIKQITMQLVSLTHLCGHEHPQQKCTLRVCTVRASYPPHDAKPRHCLSSNPGTHRTKPRPIRSPLQGHRGARERCASGGHTLRRAPILASSHTRSRAPCGPPRCLRAPALRHRALLSEAHALHDQCASVDFGRKASSDFRRLHRCSSGPPNRLVAGHSHGQGMQVGQQLQRAHARRP